MPIYNLPNATEGLDDLVVNTVTGVPSFIPMLLLFVFGLILLGGATAQKRRQGTADIPMWATMSSIATLIVSLILTLKEGLMQIDTLSIVVVITIFSGFWLFFDRNRNEV